MLRRKLREILRMTVSSQNCTESVVEAPGSRRHIRFVDYDDFERCLVAACQVDEVVNRIAAFSRRLCKCNKS